MREALRLAHKGLGRVSPNPMVGALVVKEKKIIGRGYHRDFGGPHAEVNALENVKEASRGAILYVTLEPCVHYGKTPPCVDLIIEKKIGRVVVGTIDPNPVVRGKGIQRLREHGIQVDVGVLERRCQELNEFYFKYQREGIPFVTLKMAQSLDGRIATVTGDSQWISSPESLKLAHRWRTSYDAAMVGIDTVLSDNPNLTVRLVRGKNPLRLVMDSTLRIPLESRVLSDGHASQTIVLTTDHADSARIREIEELGARVLSVRANPEGRIDLDAALRKLGKESITSVLVEGGARLGTSFLKAGLVDKLLVVIGPKIIGKGIEGVGDLGIADLSQALQLSIEKTRRVGQDVVVVARIRS